MNVFSFFSELIFYDKLAISKIICCHKMPVSCRACVFVN